MKRIAMILVMAAVCAGSLVMAAENWVSKDIGTDGGKTQINKDAVTVTAGGKDIWDNADGFRFVYQSASGNVEVSAKISSLKEINEWSKAGVMIRESAAEGSKHVMLVVTPQHGLAFQYRPEADDVSQHVEAGDFTYPVYLKVKKTGNKFEGFTSSDGKKWNLAGEIEVDMGKSALAGLAVTSHVEGELTEAKFSDVKVTTLK